MESADVDDSHLYSTAADLVKKLDSLMEKLKHRKNQVAVVSSSVSKQLHRKQQLSQKPQQQHCQQRGKQLQVHQHHREQCEECPVQAFQQPHQQPHQQAHQQPHQQPQKRRQEQQSKGSLSAPTQGSEAPGLYQEQRDRNESNRDLTCDRLESLEKASANPSDLEKLAHLLESVLGSGKGGDRHERRRSSQGDILAGLQHKEDHGDRHERRRSNQGDILAGLQHKEDSSSASPEPTATIRSQQDAVEAVYEPCPPVARCIRIEPSELKLTLKLDTWMVSDNGFLVIRPTVFASRDGCVDAAVKTEPKNPSVSVKAACRRGDNPDDGIRPAVAPTGAQPQPREQPKQKLQVQRPNQQTNVRRIRSLNKSSVLMKPYQLFSAADARHLMGTIQSEGAGIHANNHHDGMSDDQTSASSHSEALSYPECQPDCSSCQMPSECPRKPSDTKVAGSTHKLIERLQRLT